MARRMFYVDEVQGGAAVVRGETAQHLRKVLRAERGQQYEISDGEQLYLAEIADFGKDAVEFRVVEPLTAPRRPADIRLYQALIKFDHFEWILEKATELGVERITPVYSIRCDKGLDSAAPKRRERWLRILAESGQQCRRVAPPVLDEPVKLQQALGESGGARIFLDEQVGGDPLLRALPPDDGTVSLLCGPEGGWDPRERAAAVESGWQSATLGELILRAETAAISAMAVVNSARLAAN